MKRILLAASLGAAPMFSVAGQLSDEFYDFVDVEYWGRLETCTGDCSNLPSVLHGRFEIDLSLAPPDLRPDPGFGHYERARFGFVAPGFVIASEQPLGQFRRGHSGDQVIVSDLSPSDSYRVRNFSAITSDGTVNGPVLAEQRLEVGVFSFGDWGVEGDSIAQQFDVRTTDIGGEGEGVFEEFIDGVSRSYRFVVDRLRATPRVCRP